MLRELGGLVLPQPQQPASLQVLEHRALSASASDEGWAQERLERLRDLQAEAAGALAAREVRSTDHHLLICMGSAFIIVQPSVSSRLQLLLYHAAFIQPSVYPARQGLVLPEVPCKCRTACFAILRCSIRTGAQDGRLPVTGGLATPEQRSRGVGKGAGERDARGASGGIVKCAHAAGAATEAEWQRWRQRRRARGAAGRPPGAEQRACRGRR